MKVLITGGCGFIGSAVVRHIQRFTADQTVIVDAMTYAASVDALELAGDPIRADIRDRAAMDAIFASHQPDAVMHLAAETHVDRSIDGPGDFVTTNVVGTYTLLEASRAYWAALPAVRREKFRFHHVSTDEVFGALADGDPPFTEETPYDPRSPYAATKAASDHLVRAWQHTYGFPAFVTNTTNNYGPWQFPEKLIPLVTINAILGRPLPVYGEGLQTRDWLYVDDHAAALVAALERARPGDTLAIGAAQQRRNIDVVRAICAALDDVMPDPEGPHARKITHVEDRPGHDFRYAIDPSRAKVVLDWSAAHEFDAGIRKTVLWYVENRAWWERLRDVAAQRRGVAA